MAGAVGYRIYVAQRTGDYGQGAPEDVRAPTPDADGVVRHVVRGGVAGGMTSYFVVTSYDADGRESAFSNEISLTRAPTQGSSATAPTDATPRSLESLTPTIRPSPELAPPTPTPTPRVGTPTAARAAAGACPGDCSGRSRDGGDIATGVGIALGGLPIDRCPEFDTTGDARITVDEVVRAIASALNGCPPPAP